MVRTREPAAAEVGEIVSAIAGLRPDLDAEVFNVYFQLKRIVHALDQMRTRFAKARGLNVADVGVLLALRRGGPGFAIRPTDLYRRLLVTSGTMTKQIDKLARRGLVKRVPAKGDGRSVLVRLTARGEHIADALLDFAHVMLDDFQRWAGIDKRQRARSATMLATWADAAERASQIDVSQMPGRQKRAR